MDASAPAAPPVHRCPVCSLEQTEPADECARCGVVFAKLRSRDEHPPARPAAGEIPSPVDAVAAPWIPEDEPTTLGAEGRRALAVGAAIAAVVLALPFLRFVFSYMTILVHELGHAIFGWLFGYPSIPAFDFYYGGGLTSHEDRQAGLLLVIFAGWAALLWVSRRHAPALIAVGATLAVWAACAFTSFHEQLITFMGHGTELVFAGIFLFRAMSGSAVKIPVERPLYAFLGWFMLASVSWFALGLMRDPLKRAIYEEAKGGGHWMDLSRLASAFGVELTAVAGFLFVCSLFVAPAAYLALRRRHAIVRTTARLVPSSSERA
jgi:hypothetical protein